MKKVIILRGIPGSGKSFYAKKLLEEALFQMKDLSSVGMGICSADYYFEKSGEYKFDPSKLGEAHAECFRFFIDSLNHGNDLTIVDNTNTTALEIAPYIQGAMAFGYEYEIIYIHCDVDVAFKRQTHDVPLNTMKRMDDNICQVSLPPYWKAQKKINNTDYSNPF